MILYDLAVGLTGCCVARIKQREPPAAQRVCGRKSVPLFTGRPSRHRQAFSSGCLTMIPAVLPATFAQGVDAGTFRLRPHGRHRSTLGDYTGSIAVIEAKTIWAHDIDGE